MNAPHWPGSNLIETASENQSTKRGKQKESSASPKVEKAALTQTPSHAHARKKHQHTVKTAQYTRAHTHSGAAVRKRKYDARRAAPSRLRSQWNSRLVAGKTGTSVRNTSR